MKMIHFDKINIIKKLAFCLFLLMTLSASATTQNIHSVPAHSLNNNVATELVRLLSAYQTYQADFTQSTYGQNGKLLQQSQGTVKIVRPGRFRWEITTPVKQVIIANGQTLWIYDIDLAQASKQTLKQHGLSPAVLLSSSINDLTQKFQINQLKNQWFELIPKEKKSNFPVIRILFSNNVLTALQMQNSLGQNNVFYFTHIKLNQSLPEKWFELTPNKKINLLTQ